MHDIKPGSLVRVASIISAAEIQHLFATVLSVAPIKPELVGEDDAPTISIAYVDPAADPAILGSASWHNALRRQVGVAHASHADVIAGKRSIYWIDILPDPTDIHPLPGGLPELSTAESTVYSRAKAEDFFNNRAARIIPRKVEPVPVETGNAKEGTGPSPVDPTQSTSSPAGASSGLTAATPQSESHPPINGGTGDVAPDPTPATTQTQSASENGSAAPASSLPDTSNASQANEPTAPPPAPTEGIASAPAAQ